MARSLIKDPYSFLRIMVIGALLFMFCWGLAVVVFEIRPFWIDEWRLIYNFKFKDAHALWGPLDYTQQCPRIYLQALKKFTSALDYSYFSLRFPAFLITCANMLLCWQLLNRIFPQKLSTRFLFVMILISSFTFTDYFVQTKHYAMEIFLDLVALWQLMELSGIKETGKIDNKKYALLCLSFLAAPFFSYTYPIAVAPIYFVVFIQFFIKNKLTTEASRKTVLLQWFPLLLGIISIAIFYVVDVSQLMADNNMHQYWQYRMMGKQFSFLNIAEKLWGLFAKVGAGLAFEIIFGVLGIAAFVFAIRKSLKDFRIKHYSMQLWISLYAISLLIFAVLLFLAGKIPLSEPKFNAFSVPSIAVLIIYFLDMLRLQGRLKMFSIIISTILFLGLFGNIISTFCDNFFTERYARRISTYRNTQKAIVLAQSKNIPILVTPSVAYPDDIALEAAFLETMPAACVLKTFSKYDARQLIPVYTIPDLASANSIINSLPQNIDSVLVGDGINYKVLTR